MCKGKWISINKKTKKQNKNQKNKKQKKKEKKEKYHLYVQKYFDFPKYFLDWLDLIRSPGKPNPNTKIE